MRSENSVRDCSLYRVTQYWFEKRFHIFFFVSHGLTHANNTIAIDVFSSEPFFEQETTKHKTYVKTFQWFDMLRFSVL